MPNLARPKSTNSEPISVHPSLDSEQLAGLLNFLADLLSKGQVLSKGADAALQLLSLVLRALLIEGATMPFEGQISEAISRLPRTELGGGKVWSREGLTKYVDQGTKFVQASAEPTAMNKVKRRISDLSAKEREPLLTGVRTNELESIRKVASFTGFDVIPGPSVVRAVRAAVWCWFLYEEDPLRMIERARHGHQHAVIDLVKVDRLFLTDDCTAAVIRNASVNNDLKFFGQLISALKYKPSVTDREFCQLLVYMLLSLDVELPNASQLQNVVDPDGTIFPGIYAFEKYVQRARAKFERMTSQRTTVPSEPDNE
jgi:hypothetical protein